MMKKIRPVLPALLLLSAVFFAVPAFAGGCDYYDLYGDHEWVQKDVGYATCEQDGYYVLECQTCHETKKVITDTATGHAWYETGEQAASTCSTAGWHKMRCSRCGEEITFTLPLKEHTWSFVGAGQKATCTDGGWYVEECSVCGKTRNIPTAATGHDWRVDSTVPSTCLTKGHKEEICYNCGQMRTTELPLGDHTWGAFTVTVPATDHTKGVRTKSCTVCGKQEKEEFFPDGTIYKGGPGGDPVKDAQQKLIDLGYLQDVADGSFGGKTEAAVKAFQTANGLAADGIGWPQTLTLLAAKWNEAFGQVDIGEEQQGFLGENEYPPMCLRITSQDGVPLVLLCEEHAQLAILEHELGMDGITEEDLTQLDEAWTEAVHALYGKWADAAPDEVSREVIRDAETACFDSLERSCSLALDGETVRHRIRMLQQICGRLCDMLGEGEFEE